MVNQIKFLRNGNTPICQICNHPLTKEDFNKGKIHRTNAGNQYHRKCFYGRN